MRNSTYFLACYQMYHLPLWHIGLVYVLSFLFSFQIPKCQKVFMNNLAVYFGPSFLPSLSLAYNHSIQVIPIKCHNIELGIFFNQSCTWKVAAACGWTSWTLVKNYLYFLSRSNVPRLHSLRAQRTPTFIFSSETDLCWSNDSRMGSRSALIPAHQRRVLYFDLTGIIIISDYLGRFVLKEQSFCFYRKRFYRNLFPWLKKSNS